MFLGSGYTTRLLRKLPDVWTNEKSKIASVNRKLMYTIFDSSQIRTSSSLRSKQASKQAYSIERHEETEKMKRDER